MRQLFLAGIFLSIPAGAWAQIGRATIQGTVYDPQQTVIQGAAVRVTQTETNTVFTTTTNEAGYFLVPGVPVGSYSITAEMQGFKRGVRSGIVVQVGDQTRVDFTLEIGTVAESVEVVGAAPLVDTSSATVGKVIENARMTGLPLNGRSALALVVLTPNVRSHAESPHGFGDRGVLVSGFSVNGGPSGANNLMLDGSSNVNPRAGDVNVNPAVDAIQEFKVQSGVMSAEYGYTAGGVVNMVTKSGTNQFHGSLYEFIRNDKLDARNAFAAVKAPFRYNQFGGAIGGPVRRDKTFFFFNYEEWRFRRQYTVIGTTPIEEQRRGDLSRLADARGNRIPVYDPQTTAPNTAGGGFTRQLFPNNVIPTSRLDPVSQRILPFYPTANRTPTDPFTNSNNFLGNLGANKDAEQMSAKGDHNFGSKNRLSARYTVWAHKDDNGGTGNGYYPERFVRVRNDNYANKNFNLTDSHFFSPSFINELRIGVVRNAFPFVPQGVGTNPASKLGLPSSVPDVTLPAVNAPGTPAIQAFPGGFGTINGFLTMDTRQLFNSVTWIKGTHTLKIGGELRQNMYSINACFQCSGVFNFNARLTGNPQSLAGTGTGFASFLLGAVADANIDSNVGTTNPSFTQAYFFQDDWKATRRLTVNLGLRYDYQQVPGERNNGLSNFNPGATNPQNGLQGRLEFAGVDFGRTVIDPDFNDFGPRIGFALDIFGTGRTVLRGGYGLYYPLTHNFATDFGALGYRGNSTVYAAPGGNLDFPSFNFKDGFPSPVVLPIGNRLGPSAFLSGNVTTDQRNGRTPYSQQFTLTIQHQLPGRILMESSYSGNRGTKLRGGSYDLNQLDPVNLALGTRLNELVPNPFQGRVTGAFGGASITRQQSLRPFPYYNRIGVANPHMANSNYHSFLLNFEKRMADGFVMLASYTYGKLISDGIVGFGFAGSELVNQNDMQNGRFDRRSERAIEATDSAGRFVFSSIYELPFGKGKRFNSSSGAVNRIIGGWQVDGVLTLQSGSPLAVRGANNFLANRPNSTGVSAKLPADQRSTARWFDTSQFVNPPNFTFGNVGRLLPDVRGPGIRNLDLSVIKTTQITERVGLQFRAESFNVSNRVNLLSPNTSFVAGPDGRNQSGVFGTITRSRDARVVQLALKLIF
ncbi:MAG: hypothetical protein FJW39_25200 [Acidobacteria bacterium]|nr:hypothetical protein [Acidobacteriota bacterium]